MDYQVPQGIEEETKLIGPFTLKQFFISMGLGLVSFMMFFIFEFWLWIGSTFVMAVAALGLMIGRVHGRPASDLVLHALKYFWQPRLYLWTKPTLKPEELFVAEPNKKPQKPAAKKEEVKVLTPEKIKELAKQLNRSKTN